MVRCSIHRQHTAVLEGYTSIPSLCHKKASICAGGVPAVRPSSRKKKNYCCAGARGSPAANNSSLARPPRPARPSPREAYAACGPAPLFSLFYRRSSLVTLSGDLSSEGVSLFLVFNSFRQTNWMNKWTACCSAGASAAAATSCLLLCNVHLAQKE